MENFDYHFYSDLYPDLIKAGINTEYKAYKHYLISGKKEGRICNLDQMKENIKQTNNQIEDSTSIKIE